MIPLGRVVLKNERKEILLHLKRCWQQAKYNMQSAKRGGNYGEAARAQGQVQAYAGLILFMRGRSPKGWR